jgi:hypothetical protein
MSVNDAFTIVTDESKVTLQIRASLTEDSRGVIYNRNLFIAQVTGVIREPENGLTG